MAEEEVLEEENNEAENGEEGSEETSPKKGKKKLVILLLVVILLLGGGGAGLYFSGLIPGFGAGSKEKDEKKVPQIVYYDLEEFLVNLNNPGKQVSFLKMTVTLELPDLQAKAEVEAKMPRIRDSFQVYLRELRNADLQGSAGIHRLREELLLRINKILEPIKINDILFKDMIVQ